jgi:transcriptional antiterminator NusG
LTAKDIKYQKTRDCDTHGGILLNWYALFVETGEEETLKKYVNILLPGKLKTLIPKRKLIERKQGKTKEKVRKLFPGYVLVRGQMNDEMYYTIKNLPPVITVLRGDMDPVPISGEEMDLILTLTDGGELIEFSQIYKEGDKIKVLKGPLYGMEGIIERVDHRKKRVKVCFDFLGRERRVDLGAEIIVKDSV